MAEAKLSELDWLLGEWQGYGIVGKQYNLIRKSYAYEVGGTFLVERTLSMFPPGKPDTEFEMHQDFMVLHQNGDQLGAKGFYIEGFVSQSEVNIADGGKQIVIESTTIENGPPGTRTRYTLTRESDDAFKGQFEIAWPGQDFELSQKITMKRIG